MASTLPPLEVRPVAAPNQSQQIFDRAWESYAVGIKANIFKEAKAQAGGTVTEADAFRALDQFFRDVPPLNPSGMERFYRGLSANLFLIICVVMTIIFGLLAWQLSGTTGDTRATESKAFLDMAKIFAGAIVGSAAGRGMSRRREPR